MYTFRSVVSVIHCARQAQAELDHTRARENMHEERRRAGKQARGEEAGEVRNEEMEEAGSLTRPA